MRKNSLKGSRLLVVPHSGQLGDLCRIEAVRFSILLAAGRLQDESAAINSEIIGLLFALTQTTLSQACYYFMRLAGFGSTDVGGCAGCPLRHSCSPPMRIRLTDTSTREPGRSKDDMPVIDLSQGTDHPARHLRPTVVRRLTTLMREVQLDCECHSRLDEALVRFAALEEQREACEHLASARRQRERIDAVLFFLQDLDDLTVTEGDRSVYLDIALLFDDIATTARAGAFAMRQLSACPAEADGS